MREIKFRAWDVITKKWFDDIFGLSNDGRKFYNHDGWEYDVPERMILTQYTGVKDNRGVEIYEGDIVDYEEESGSSRGVCVYTRSSSFALRLIGTEDKKYPTYRSLWDYDIDQTPWTFMKNPFIIRGNKYEDPELLKG
jgi:uncharacterized phage protein (TIGR01671 family)